MSEKRTETADLSGLRIDRDAEAVETSGPGKTRAAVLIAVFVFVSAIIIFFLLQIRESTSVFEVAEVVMVYPTQADVVLTASGYVVAQRQAAVASKGTGRLEYLNVEEGDAVRKGQVIAQLEHDDVDAALAQARANLAMASASLVQAEAEFNEAKLNFKRQSDLVDKGLISKSKFDIAEARFKSSQAAVAAAKAQVDQAKAAVVSAQVDVENMRIRAPFEGTVLTKNADVGEMVAPFAASSNSRGAVVTIADMASLQVEADVSESNIQRVHPGQLCEIVLDAFPSHRYPGYVYKIIPTADRAKATVLTKIEFKQRDQKVLPEMSAKVNFLSDLAAETDGELEPFIAVPASALLQKEGHVVVFSVRGNRVTETPVTVGREVSGRVQIVDGLTPGQVVVINPTGDLRSGNEIKVDRNTEGQ